jgi:hypothetical protein
MRVWGDNVSEMSDADTSPCPRPPPGQPDAHPALSTQNDSSDTQPPIADRD